MPRKKAVAPAIPFDFKDAVSRLLKVKPEQKKAVARKRASPKR
jgi:hypothetical protein